MDSQELERKIANGLKSHYNVDTRVDVYKHYTLYNVNNIIKVFNVKHPNRFLNKCNKEEIVIYNDIKYFTYKGLLKVFHTFEEYDDLDDILYKFGVDFLHDSYIATNVDVLKNIQKVFSNERTMLYHNILNYKVDLFFPDYNIIIECEENIYRNIIGNEMNSSIERVLENCSFIRYDPYIDNFDCFELLSKINTEIMSKISNTNSLILKTISTT